jgi:hypothetical protein
MARPIVAQGASRDPEARRVGSLSDGKAEGEEDVEDSEVAQAQEAHRVASLRRLGFDGTSGLLATQTAPSPDAFTMLPLASLVLMLFM